MKSKGQRTFQSIKDAPKLRKDWDLSNCHDMKGRFRFEINGRFNQNGELLEKEVINLVDWKHLKIRKVFISVNLNLPK